MELIGVVIGTGRPRGEENLQDVNAGSVRIDSSLGEKLAILKWRRFVQPFMIQEPTLCVESPAKPSERTVCTDHPMTGHDD
jgi:hypothetical protein